MRHVWTAFGAAAALAVGALAWAQSPGLAQRLERLASGGNAEAAYHLGMLYNNGLGVPQDPTTIYDPPPTANAAGAPRRLSLSLFLQGCLLPLSKRTPDPKTQ